MAQGKKTGGRQKGSKNKANVQTSTEIAATGETPLEYMVRVMRETGADYDRRDRMAVAAAPYVHQKLAATEITGKDGGPVQLESMTELDIGRRLAFLLARAKRKIEEI